MEAPLAVLLAAAALISVVGSPAAAQSQADNAGGRQPIRYTLSFPAPQTHYVDVVATIPTDGRPEVELMMAVWTPGSYLVREY